MRTFRFGPHTAVPINEHGSTFRIQPFLVSPKATCRAEIAYLAPGGLIGQHPAGLPQLFVVLSGSGMVSGNDSVERPIGAGEAAFWDAGEMHRTHSADGLTALIIQSVELAPEKWLTEDDLGEGEN